MVSVPVSQSITPDLSIACLSLCVREIPVNFHYEMNGGEGWGVCVCMCVCVDLTPSVSSVVWSRGGVVTLCSVSEMFVG